MSYDIARTTKEIDEQIARSEDTKRPKTEASFEDGVQHALLWLLGEWAEPPLPDLPDSEWATLPEWRVTRDSLEIPVNQRNGFYVRAATAEDALKKARKHGYRGVLDVERWKEPILKIKDKS